MNASKEISEHVSNWKVVANSKGPNTDHLSESNQQLAYI